MGQCQIVPVLRSFFYVPTSSNQVLAPLSSVIFFRLCVLKAQSLDPNPLLDGPMELSVSSFQLTLTSVDLVTSLCHLALAITISPALLPAFPSCPSSVLLLSKVRKGRTTFLLVISPLVLPLCFSVPEKNTYILLTVLLPPFLQSPTENKIKILKENMSILRLSMHLILIILRLKRKYVFSKESKLFLNYHICKIANSQRRKKWLCSDYM